MKKCDHEWVRYIIKKSVNGINYRCVICKKCGKAHIEEPGLITIEEGFFGDGVIDIKKLWAEAETPDLESEEFLKSYGMIDCDEEINPNLRKYVR